MVWKVIGGFALSAIIATTYVLAFQRVGWITNDPRALKIAGIAMATILAKITFGVIASGKFEYHRQGYDLCLMAVAGGMTTAAMLVPSGGSGMTPHQADLMWETFLTLAFAIATTAMTAFICRELQAPVRPKAPNALSLINWL